MTAAERTEHQQKMLALRTCDECKAYTEEHQKLIDTRAKKKAMTLRPQRVSACDQIEGQGHHQSSKSKRHACHRLSRTQFNFSTHRRRPTASLIKAQQDRRRACCHRQVGGRRPRPRLTSPVNYYLKDRYEIHASNSSFDWPVLWIDGRSGSCAGCCRHSHCIADTLRGQDGDRRIPQDPPL